MALNLHTRVCLPDDCEVQKMMSHDSIACGFINPGRMVNVS